MARTQGYVIHHLVVPNDETSDGAAGTTSTRTSQGKAVDRGGKRASETDDHGGKRVSRVGDHRLANDAQSGPSNDPPPIAGCVICGGVDPMYGGTVSCPQCSQSLCPECFPPTQHQPCCSSSSTSFEIIPPSVAHSCPLHFITCAGKSASKARQSTTDSLNSAILKCRRDKVAERSTSSRGSQRGSGGGDGGGDDRRNYRQPLPEDVYT